MGVFSAIYVAHFKCLYSTVLPSYCLVCLCLYSIGFLFLFSKGLATTTSLTGACFIFVPLGLSHCCGRLVELN